MRFKIGELVQWISSDGQLFIDVIRKNNETGEGFFWNLDFDQESYHGLAKLDVSVPYFNDGDIFVECDYRDKVCGECVYSVRYNNEECDLHEIVIYPDDEACPDFEPLLENE